MLISFSILISIQNKSIVTFKSFEFGVRKKKDCIAFFAYCLWNKRDTLVEYNTRSFVHSFYISHELWQQRRMFHFTYCPKSTPISMLPKNRTILMHTICSSFDDKYKSVQLQFSRNKFSIFQSDTFIYDKRDTSYMT